MIWSDNCYGIFAIWNVKKMSPSDLYLGRWFNTALWHIFDAGVISSLQLDVKIHDRITKAIICDQENQVLRGCTPIHSENSCCPRDWLCPGEAPTTVISTRWRLYWWWWGRLWWWWGWLWGWWPLLPQPSYQQGSDNGDADADADGHCSCLLHINKVMVIIFI